MGRETTAIINALLNVIGENGLSGVRVAATHPSKAVRDLLLQLPNLTPEVQPSRILNELRRQDLVTIVTHNDMLLLQLTVKGVHRVQRSQIRSITIPPQIPWDRTWRMVVFDIPARHAQSRYLLTSELKRLGFVMLQNSMWLHPYPCFSEINAVIQYTNLQPFVTFGELSRIDTGSLHKLLAHYPELRNN